MAAVVLVFSADLEEARVSRAGEDNFREATYIKSVDKVDAGGFHLHDDLVLLRHGRCNVRDDNLTEIL